MVFVLSAILMASVIAYGCKKDKDDSSDSSSSGSYTDSTSDSSSEPSVDLPVIDQPYVGVVSGHDGSHFYQISLLTQGGAPVKGVTVNLVSQANGKIVSEVEAISSANGNVFFYAPAAYYNIRLDNVPAGYSLSATSQTATNKMFDPVTMLFDTHIITANEGAIPAGTRYTVGDVLHDFTISTRDIKVNADGDPVDNNGEKVEDISGNLISGKNYVFINHDLTMSELLTGGKNTIIINLWATWCGPCVTEMPAIESAYKGFRDKATVIAIDAAVDDSVEAVWNFQRSRGLLFDFAPYDPALVDRFNITSGIPVTVVIDRYGCVVEHVTGSLTQAQWLSIFNKYTADDYVQNIQQGGSEEEGGGQLILPTYEHPDYDKVKQAIAAGTPFTFMGDEDDEYAWPWLISDDGSYIYTSNSNIESSWSTLIVNFESKAGDVVAFDYRMQTEEGVDLLYVIIDDELKEINSPLSGVVNDWTSYYAYLDREGGSHTLILLYNKDYSDSIGEDRVCIKNMRIVTAADIDEPTFFKTNAASGLKAEAADHDYRGERYSNYATVKLYPAIEGGDNFYHIFDETKYADNNGYGPLLYVDLMYGTPWDNLHSLYNYAQGGYLMDEDGIDRGGDVMLFAGLTPYTRTGYMPVSEDVKQMLQNTISVMKNGGWINRDYSEREWLEMCVYYEGYCNYRGSERYELYEYDLTGFDFHFADDCIPMDGTNYTGDLKMLREIYMSPRGYKYILNPTVSGTYHFYSTGGTDTIAYLYDENPYIDEFSRPLVEAEGGTNGDFSFSYYLEAGHTYYLAVDYYAVIASDRILQPGSQLHVDYTGAGRAPAQTSAPAAEWAILPTPSKSSL